MGIGALALAILIAMVIGFNVGRVRERLTSRGPAAGRIQSLAVLPLENLSGDKEQDYFADGMTEELIANLGQIGVVATVNLYCDSPWVSVMRRSRVIRTLTPVSAPLKVRRLASPL